MLRELQHSVNSVWLCPHHCFKVWFGIEMLVYEHITTEYFTPTVCFCILTLFGCTALLRFSIHLSLSAAERHEKHLLPVEVVTYHREKGKFKMLW